MPFNSCIKLFFKCALSIVDQETLQKEKIFSNTDIIVYAFFGSTLKIEEGSQLDIDKDCLNVSIGLWVCVVDHHHNLHHHQQ